MITIKNPILEKRIIDEAKTNGITIDTYIITVCDFFESNKKDKLLGVVNETKKNWKTFGSVDSLMKDLTSW